MEDEPLRQPTGWLSGPFRRRDREESRCKGREDRKVALPVTMLWQNCSSFGRLAHYEYNQYSTGQVWKHTRTSRHLYLSAEAGYPAVHQRQRS